MPENQRQVHYDRHSRHRPMERCVIPDCVAEVRRLNALKLKAPGAKLERALAEVERLRVVVALQYMHAAHGFSGGHRTDLVELWKGAHTGGLLSLGHGGDPAELVSRHLRLAQATERKTLEAWRGASSSRRVAALRDRGLPNLAKLRAAHKQYQELGGTRPDSGWRVPYVPWSRNQPGELRFVLPRPTAEALPEPL